MVDLSWLVILQPYLPYAKIVTLCSLHIFKAVLFKNYSENNFSLENKNKAETSKNLRYECPLSNKLSEKRHVNSVCNNKRLLRNTAMITKIDLPKNTLKHYLIQRTFLSFDEFPKSNPCNADWRKDMFQPDRKPLIADSFKLFRLIASSVSMTRNPFSGGPVEMGIRKKLTEKLKPTHLEVINESYKHNTPPAAESHFKMVVVSELFRDMPLVKRHQAINSLLTEELKTSVHAISIDAKTPEQWNVNPEVNPTPKCLGGFGR